jgi:hypothetical protein
MVPDPRRVPEWQLRAASATVYKLNGGAAWHYRFIVPVDARCVGAFLAEDDRSDLWTYAQDAAGKRIGVPIKPKGDIEIMILNLRQYDDFVNFRSHTAVYTSGRSFGDTFSVDLAAGWYELVVSNRHSILAGKSVTLAFGGKLDGRTP